MMVQATRCPDCSSYVSRDIYFGRFGKRNNVPLWVCPNCGVVHEDYRWFKYVSQQEANAIIEHRGPAVCLCWRPALSISASTTARVMLGRRSSLI